MGERGGEGGGGFLSQAKSAPLNLGWGAPSRSDWGHSGPDTGLSTAWWFLIASCQGEGG